MTALDVSRYAPNRRLPAVVWDNPAPQPRAMTDLDLAGIGLAAARRIAWLSLRLAAHEMRRRARVRFGRVMGSLSVAWAASGFGWGTAIGLLALHQLMR